MRGRVVEIESLDELDRLLDRLLGQGARSVRGWRVQSVDLSGRTTQLAGLDVAGAVFLGCRFAEGDESDVRRRGALVFPSLPDVPFDPYRSRLYTPAELYEGLEQGYDATLDARIYAWHGGERSIDRTLASALHDHSVDDALEEYLAGRRVIGVMGGHATLRGSADYRAAARLGHVLAEDFTVATGGGPGAMEAANLGAFVTDGLDAVIDEVAAVADFKPDLTAWARCAMTVRSRVGEGRDSLGVPTWFYGHEPPNIFASTVAKYFRNAIREDVLLRVCRAGIVYLPGAAGTVQEVFQAACENYYAAPDEVAPMVLVGRRHWTEELPVWPLLERLARGTRMRVHLVDELDDLDDVADRIRG